jgi:VIT1/CCC1 family predicted Fe2+/Mn2+ transporter
MSARESWAQEMESVFLYRAIVDVEPSEERRALFAKLAGEAEAQAGIWADKMRRDGLAPPDRFHPPTRARLVAVLVRRLGPERLKSVLSAMKVRGMSIYGRDTAASSDTGAAASGRPKEHPMPSSVDEIGLRHRHGPAGGNLRAAVFGASDGLVSNVCLILGVAGARTDGHTVVISGVAGLLAGALSMAAGEYISVRSQREMFEHQINAERDELMQYPREEAAELSLIYQARGLDKDDADRMSGRIVANPRYALDALAREELGLDPGALGSPVGAASFSFASFAVGAAVPLLPFIVASGGRALGFALGLTAAALFAVGCAISLFTGRGALRGGTRMLMIGAAAGAVTYGIGRLVGAAVV